jgi:hypothetical protein
LKEYGTQSFWGGGGNGMGEVFELLVSVILVCLYKVIYFNVLFAKKCKISTVSRTALGPTQPPIEWIPGALSLGVKRPGRSVKLTTHLHLVPRSRNATPPMHLHGVVLS